MPATCVLVGREVANITSSQVLDWLLCTASRATQIDGGAVAFAIIRKSVAMAELVYINMFGTGCGDGGGTRYVSRVWLCRADRNS